MKKNLFKNKKEMKKALKVSAIALIGAVTMSTCGCSMAIKRLPDVLREQSAVKRAREESVIPITSILSSSKLQRVQEDGYLDLSDVFDKRLHRKVWLQCFDWVRKNPVVSLNLSSINLDDNVRNIISNVLHENSTLVNLNLEYNELNDDDIAILAKDLISNTSLETLKLSVGCLKDKGAIALANALKVNNSLTSLDLYNNELGDAGVSALAAALSVNSSLTHLDLGGQQLGKGGAIALAAALRENSSLTSLYLWDGDVEDEGAIALIDAIEGNGSIMSFNLACNQLSSAVATNWAELLTCNSTLTEVALGDFPLSVDLVRALKYNTNITDLNLDCSDLSDKVINELQTMLIANGTIRKLSMNVGGLLGGNNLFFKYILINNQSIDELIIEGLNSDAMRSLLQGLELNTVLTNLKLESMSSLGNEEMRVLAKELKENSSLTKLSFNGFRCAFDDAGVAAISDALRVNSSLVDFEIGKNEMGRHKIGNAGADAISKALKNNSALTRLDLGNCVVNEKGLERIADALDTNITLTDFSLCKMDVSVPGVSMDEYDEMEDSMAEGDSEMGDSMDTDTDVPSTYMPDEEM